MYEIPGLQLSCSTAQALTWRLIFQLSDLGMFLVLLSDVGRLM